MNASEIVEKRIERVRLPEWTSDAYVKIHYVEEGYGPWVYLVSPKCQKAFNIPVGSQEILFSEAFGNLETWEEYKGVPYYGF